MDQAVGTIGFDRSRVRILLCDKDPNTALEVKELLCRCSYQVSVVKTARQVVEVLNLVDSKVDLILAEVELPNGKGFKMLRHIVKTDTFKHIPIVMMSARDEMAVVVKCLRLGAADYLVKPLRINELLNLWTHMWRRRRMLGLTEKHIVNGHLATKNIIAEIFVSDTSESNNTISTDILSEESNDALFKAKESNLKTISEEQPSPELELTLKTTIKEPKPVEVSGKKFSPPRKSELKHGQTSAFLSYAKTVSRAANAERSEPTANLENPSPLCSDMHPPSQPSVNNEERHEPAGRCNGEAPAATDTNQFHPEVQWNNTSTSINEAAVQWNNGAAPRHEGGEQFPVMQMCPQNDPRAIYNQLGQSHLMPQLMMSHPLHHPSTLLQPGIHYYQAVQPENVASMQSAPAAFSYYPFPIHLPPHQVGAWTPALAAQGCNERKSGVAERREAALIKFRQKRKDRCFEKKIRYASRKRLAEQRPRNKGQFVRAEDFEEEDENYEETGRELSPESGVTQHLYSIDN